jgi:hypothetical protein
MANYNTFLIKRRTSGEAGAPEFLSGGELAFNEVGKTLYYGTDVGDVIAIGGEGSFVTLNTTQEISGAKTFTNLTTLSSVTFSPDSIIDAGGNKITNVETPTEDGDVANKSFVDSVSSALQSAIDAVGSSGGSAVTDLSAEVYDNFVKLTEDRPVTLDNLTLTGNLSVLGTQVVVNTETINISGVSTQIDIVNDGTATGLTVNQNGTEDIAEFKDDGVTALIIKGSNEAPGYVGIGTSDPNEKLTVVGNISATGTVYSAGGMEIASDGGDTTLFVEDGKVGINTEAPNEELTVVGDISATGDIFARNGDFTGTLDVDGVTTFGSTLSVVGDVTFDAGLTVAGGVTFSTDLSGNGTTSAIYGFILDGGTY